MFRGSAVSREQDLYKVLELAKSAWERLLKTRSKES